MIQHPMQPAYIRAVSFHTQRALADAGERRNGIHNIQYGNFIWRPGELITTSRARKRSHQLMLDQCLQHVM
mgnify:CR=1 FL=1